MQTDRICDTDATAVQIPEKLLAEKTLAVIKKSLQTLLSNQKSRHVFFALYPHLRDGGDWVVPSFFNHIQADPKCAALIKSPQTLYYYMKHFTEAGLLLTTNGDGKTAYHLNPEIWWNILGSPEFKEEVGFQYHHIYIIACIITRVLKDLFLTVEPGAIYDLTHTLMSICTDLALADLRAREIPDHPCPDCNYQYEVEDLPIADDHSKVPEITPFQEESHNLLSPQTQPPAPPPKPSEDTMTILDRNNTPEIPRQPTPTPSSPPADPRIPINVPLEQQIYLYIEKQGGESGVAHKVLVKHFTAQGADRVDIDTILKEGINDGKYYQRSPGKYRIL